MSNIKYPIVLFGKTGSGKTSVAKAMEKLGIKRLISYTTRPKRSGKKDGVEYHFVSEDQFFDMVDHGQIAEITSRSIGGTDYYYGTAIENYGRSDPSVCVMDLNGIRTLRVMGIPHTAVLLNVKNDYAMARCFQRGDSPDETTKRLKLERMTFASAPTLADVVIDANNPLPAVMQEIIEIVKDDLSMWKHIVPVRDPKTNFFRLYGTDSNALSSEKIVAYVHRYSGDAIYVHPRAQYDPKLKAEIKQLQEKISASHPLTYEWMEEFFQRYFATFPVNELKKLGFSTEQIQFFHSSEI